jgi:predicted nucleic acid-binding Zn ribbon protein
MGLDEKINLFAIEMVLGIGLMLGSGFYLTRSFESGEWNLKKKNAIYQ